MLRSLREHGRSTWPRLPASGGFKPSNNWDSHAGAIHGTKPPQDCLSGGVQLLAAGRGGAVPQRAIAYCAVAQQVTQ